MLQAAAAVSGAGVLGGCAAINPLSASPPQLYTLSPKSTFSPNLPTVQWQLLIETPAAAAGLDSARIALRQSATTLDYYAEVAWTDRAPLMVQTLLVESFENTGRIVSVGREAIGLRADFVLKTELREFQVESFDVPVETPRVRINAKLVRIPEREIIASENFERTQAAATSSFETVILAFDEALDGVLRDLVEWALIAGEYNWRLRPDSGS